MCDKKINIIGIEIFITTINEFKICLIKEFWRLKNELMLLAS